MDLREIGWGGMDWIDLPQDSGQWKALVKMEISLRGPQNVGKFLSTCTTGGFSRSAQLRGVSHTFEVFSPVQSIELLLALIYLNTRFHTVYSGRWLTAFRKKVLPRFYPEDGSTRLLRTIGTHLSSDYTVSQSTVMETSDL
jgi:hypothetical protein